MINLTRIAPSCLSTFEIKGIRKSPGRADVKQPFQEESVTATALFDPDKSAHATRHPVTAIGIKPLAFTVGAVTTTMNPGDAKLIQT